MEKSKAAKAQRIFARVLPKIKPSELEIAASIANANRISERLKKLVPKNVEIMIVGSLARGTNLKGDADIDMFLLFDKAYSNKKVAELGMSYAKKIVKKNDHERFEIRYAEHPYVRLYLDDLNIKLDIVPAYKIRDINEMGTSVDRSPLHVQFLNSKLTNKQRDEVRLFKYLLKAHSIYGAEVKTKGFSGFMCELLIYHYGSLIKLLEASAYLQLPICINPLERSVIKDKGIFKRFNSEFVVLDPVDQSRNAAAGVSQHVLAKLALVAREFLENPSINSFYGKGFSSDKVQSMLNDFLKRTKLEVNVIRVPVPNKTEDIVWPQLNKVAEIIESHLQGNGFEVYINRSWISKKNGYILLLGPHREYGAMLMKGPKVFAGQFSQAFLKKHRKAEGIMVKDIHIYALEKAKFATSRELVKSMLKNHVLARKKDIPIKKAKALDAIPKEESLNAFAEITKKITI